MLFFSVTIADKLRMGMSGVAGPVGLITFSDNGRSIMLNNTVAVSHHHTREFLSTQARRTCSFCPHARCGGNTLLNTCEILLYMMAGRIVPQRHFAAGKKQLRAHG